MASRRIYSETVSYTEIVRPRTLDLLSRYGLELVLAVRPGDERDLPRVAGALHERGVPLSVWPMLDDASGRWMSVGNAREFSGWTLAICDVLAAAGLSPRDVLFDMEPSIFLARALAAMGGRGEVSPPGVDERRGEVDADLLRLVRRPRSAAFDVAAETIASASREIHDRQIATSAAVWPLVALDPPGDRPWQSLLGTPVDALGVGHVSVMMYTSILEGWSRGTLRRKDASALLGAAAARAVGRWGPRAGVSLGCVGTGALEDEPIYREPAELAEDVAVALASGCEHLSLFDLGGVLSRRPAEAWLEAFVHTTKSASSPGGTRVQAARAVAHVATWTLGLRSGVRSKRP